MKVSGTCQLNLTGISGRISLLGVRKCDADSELTIYSVSYCHDEDSTDSYIDVDVTEDQVVITAGKVTCSIWSITMVRMTDKLI